MQICMWGNFAAQDAQRYDLIKANLEAIEKTNHVFRKINNYCMWINPFQKWSYGAWSDGTNHYVASMQGLILANEPNLYLGQYVSIQFKWDSFKPAKNGYYIAKNKKVKVLLKYAPKNQIISVSGTVQSDPEVQNGIIITK